MTHFQRGVRSESEGFTIQVTTSEVKERLCYTGDALDTKTWHQRIRKTTSHTPAHILRQEKGLERDDIRTAMKDRQTSLQSHHNSK